MGLHKRYYIIGAGEAGKELAREIIERPALGSVSAFIEDDPEKIGKRIYKIPVKGPLENIESIFIEHPAEEAIIAMPAASQNALRRVYSILQNTKVQRIKLLPGVSQVLEGDAHYIQVRDIQAQDLLAREPVVIPLKQSLEYLRDRRVLITGAGGSIGSEMSRQLLSGGTQRLYLLDNSEYNLYEIEKDLRILQEEGVGEQATIVPILGDLKDRDHLEFLLPRLKADVIFHSAAYKHVPMLEDNSIEGIKNNIFGTKNIVETAEASGASRFVFISTDKVVEPSSIYGASKHIAEEIVLHRTGMATRFMVVRFGNVLGSQGSILPLFKKQIQKGGPVTITDKECMRYFMTIPEAASLVLQTGGLGDAGGMYLTELGEPRRIEELACRIISFYGFKPYEEIPIKITGLRPGEKLTESLRYIDEEVAGTPVPGVMKLKRPVRLGDNIDNLLEDLWSLCSIVKGKENNYRNRRVAREILNRHLPGVEKRNHETDY